MSMALQADIFTVDRIRSTATVPVTVYGPRHDRSTMAVRLYLSCMGIANRLEPIDRRSAFSQTPVVDFDGEWLVAPTMDQLRAAARRYNRAAS